MSLYYYGRMRFITNLLPLLTASSLPAHCISVYAAGKEGKLLTDDLSLRKPSNHTMLNLRSHMTFMTQFFMEELAKQYPGKLSLENYFPGLVLTDAFNTGKMPLWFTILWRVVLQHLGRLFAVPHEESGERVLFLASSRYPARDGNTTTKANGDKREVAMGSDGVLGGGAYSCNWNDDANAIEEVYKNHRNGTAQLVWDHTMKAFSEIEAGRAFKD